MRKGASRVLFIFMLMRLKLHIISYIISYNHVHRNMSVPRPSGDLQNVSFCQQHVTPTHVLALCWFRYPWKLFGTQWVSECVWFSCHKAITEDAEFEKCLGSMSGKNAIFFWEYLNWKETTSIKELNPRSLGLNMDPVESTGESLNQCFS